MPRRIISLLITLFPAAARALEYEEPPHHYFTTPLRDAVTKFGARLTSGAITLPPASSRQTLLTVLQHLEIPVASQVLVFSKTSLQKDLISPSSPRALYFNDDVYLGWVPGGTLEITAMDPHVGAVFYTLDPQHPDRPLDRPDNCLNCHAGSMTDSIPGLMLRSVYTDARGEVLFSAGTQLTDHTSPLTSRWGGYYVTGHHGTARHMGNALATQHPDRVTLDTTHTSNLRSLAALTSIAHYPHPESDIIAHMVLAHQVTMHNRLTAAAYAVRGALYRQTGLRRELGEPPITGLTGSSLTVAENHAERVLEALLFRDEAPLPEGGLEGSTAFTEAFRKTRRPSSEQRSLRDLQLLTRTFKYRCSYLIYSAQWDGLPAPFLALLYEKLHTILTSPTPPAGYNYLPHTERRHILNILLQTKSNLPASWHHR